MIALLCAAWAGSVRFDRVDLLSEEGTWLVDEAPRLAAAPRPAGVRAVEELRLAVSVPRASLVFGASIASLSVSVRRPLLRRAPVYASVGLTSALGLPRGAVAGVEGWLGPVRIGLGAQVRSEASWARPVWDGWRVLPAVGLGVGRRPLPY